MDHEHEALVSRVEAWSPGGQAQADQDHAEALETMRRCKTFVLVYVEEPGELGPNGETGGYIVGTQGTGMQFLHLLKSTQAAYAQLTRLIATQLIPLVVEAAGEEEDAA